MRNQSQSKINNETIKFKPKAIVYVSIALFLVIGTVAPFLIYKHTTDFDTRSCIKICLPLLWLIPTIMAIKKVKFLEINDKEWRVKYLFTGKKIIFSKINVCQTSFSEHRTFRTRIPYTSWKIELLSGEIIQFSSMELRNTGQLEYYFRKLRK